MATLGWPSSRRTPDCGLAFEQCSHKRLWHRATCTWSTQWSIPVVLTAAEHRCSTNLLGSAHASPLRSHTLRHHHRSSQAARYVRICTAQLAGSLSTMHILPTCRLGAVPAAAVSHGTEDTAWTCHRLGPSPVQAVVRERAGLRIVPLHLSSTRAGNVAEDLRNRTALAAVVVPSPAFVAYCRHGLGMNGLHQCMPRGRVTDTRGA